MPTPIRIQIRRGPQGKAEVRVLKDSVKVIFDNGDEHEIAKDRAPKYIGTVKNGTYYVRLSTDETTLYDIRPFSGTYFVRFRRFTARKDELPAPRYEEGSWKKRRSDGADFWAEPRWVMTALLDVLGGEKYTGMVMPLTLEYCFGDFEGLTGIVGYGKPARRTQEFMERAGYDFEVDEVTYSENILPDLEAILLARRKVFMVEVENGWVKAMVDTPEGIAVPE